MHAILVPLPMKQYASIESFSLKIKAFLNWAPS